MRPLPGDDAFAARSRSGSLADNDVTPLAGRSQPTQMTYFLADERTMEASQSMSSIPRGRDSGKSSTYGVESMETSTSSVSQDSEEDEKLGNARNTWKKNLTQHLGRGSEDVSPRSSFEHSGASSPSHQRRSSQATISRPFTPLSLGSPAPASITSSPHSHRNSDVESDVDESASQAIISSGEDDQPSKLLDSGSVPQLVMPSIKMPSRRPFTDNGKNMGRLKVLIAGDSGVGKTSLIKAIVQTCEDIVHVDPISNTTVSLPEPRRSSKSKRGSLAQSTSQITEIYASTRAYPSWWSDFEDSRILRRRKSLGDSVLERNLCFIDTPGYGNKTSCLESIDPVVDYVENQLRKLLSTDGLSNSDLINMLGGNGGSQVDVVFYIISDRIKLADIEYLRRLSSLTNVIPLIAKSDTLSSEQIATLKSQTTSELQAANIRHFLFGLSSEDGLHSSRPPYAISTAPAKDNETMDASLLMSPEYVSPLIPSELQDLVTQVFESDTISWLRNSAAKKFIQWRNGTNPTSKPQSLYRPLTASTSQVLTGPVGATTSYAVARITDHTQREERLAQVRLSKWATELQRSLQNERARFENLARSERAVWLTERLGECVQDGTLVPISQAQSESRVSSTSGALVKQGAFERVGETTYPRNGMDVQDPLGILAWKAAVKKRAKIAAMRVITGVGLFAGLVLLFSESSVGREVGREMRFLRERYYDLDTMGWRLLSG